MGPISWSLYFREKWLSVAKLKARSEASKYLKFLFLTRRLILIFVKYFEIRKEIWKCDAKNSHEKNSRDYFIAGSFKAHNIISPF